MTTTATTERTVEETATKLAEEAAKTGATLLKMLGWCLWKCNALDGDLVVVVRDDPPMLESQRERMLLRLGHLKAPYVIYTEAELELLCENPNPGLLHEAKKAGAVLTGEMTPG